MKTALGREPECLTSSSGRCYPMGLLQLNAMRLADIFSDDSNFRSYVTIHFVSVTEPQSLDICFFPHSITNKEILASVPLSYFSYDGSDCFKTSTLSYIHRTLKL